MKNWLFLKGIDTTALFGDAANAPCNNYLTYEGQKRGSE